MFSNWAAVIQPKTITSMDKDLLNIRIEKDLTCRGKSSLRALTSEPLSSEIVTRSVTPLSNLPVKPVFLHAHNHTHRQTYSHTMFVQTLPGRGHQEG